MLSLCRKERRDMKYGLTLPNGAVDARTLVEFGVLAEDAGWDGVFFEDYIVYQDRLDVPTHDPWAILAGIALRTERIRLGTEVTPVARRRPWKLARETSTVDHLSQGRLILGVGSGDASEPGFRRLEGTDARRRAELLDEGLEILVGLWSGEPFHYSGRHYHLDEVVFLPPPVQRPRIPIWVGGGYPLRGPMERAARWDGACLYRHPPGENEQRMTREDVRALKRFIHDHRTNPGPYDIVVGGSERLADWDAERDHIRAIAGAGATWWTEWVPPADGEAMRASIARGPLRTD
jgi:alkanesulfonate monooxygenase SsuD/methylene tetrahydromethanopterin reductase-like flavin-dependent oxidoreductase (luciferase family)